MAKNNSKKPIIEGHEFKKGKFITTFNSIHNLKLLEDYDSWTYGRMPEYLWIGLILYKYGRSSGLKKLFSILKKLHSLASNIDFPYISNILALDDNIQREFYNYICETICKETLAPLTLIFTIDKNYEFSRYFYCSNISIENRLESIVKTMNLLMDHQSNESTDIRFLVVYFFQSLSKKCELGILSNEILKYPSYEHDAEEMKKIRASVRATELVLSNINQLEKTNKKYLQFFWECVSEMTECDSFFIEFKENEINIDIYMEKIYEVFSYISQLFLTVNPLDDRMNVIVGIATYSYKRFKEAYDHNLFNAISGRNCTRVLIENYIMLKYLLKNENTNTNIWKEYQYHGIGNYKLVLTRYGENEINTKIHFDKKYINELVNEFTDEKFIDMDTGYFNGNIRDKAKNVGEEELYYIYDYDSSFEHGLWGAIRESSLLKCCNPAHKYHCIPDIDNQNRLKSVLPDCIMIMNKTISLIDSVYGIPKSLLEEVITFEI